MVGQSESPPPANQTKEEITRSVKAKIARAKRLVRNVEKLAEKRHTSP
jgi:hypothetical protein